MALANSCQWGEMTLGVFFFFIFLVSKIRSINLGISEHGAHLLKCVFSNEVGNDYLTEITIGEVSDNFQNTGGLFKTDQTRGGFTAISSC